MADIARVLGGHSSGGGMADIVPVAYEAKIVNAAANVNKTVSVTVPAIDGGMHLFDGAPWTPRAGAAQELPAKGDRALVVFSENGSPWVVAWWPK